MGPTKVAATSSSLGCPRPSPNEAARTLSATAGQPNKNGQKLSKSAICPTPAVQRQQLAENLVVRDARRRRTRDPTTRGPEWSWRYFQSSGSRRNLLQSLPSRATALPSRSPPAWTQHYDQPYHGGTVPRSCACRPARSSESARSTWDRTGDPLTEAAAPRGRWRVPDVAPTASRTARLGLDAVPRSDPRPPVRRRDRVSRRSPPAAADSGAGHAGP